MIGGFANGQLKIHDSVVGITLIEIAAHGRCITSLDIATQPGLVKI